MEIQVHRAYMGIQDPIYPTLMERAEQATTAIAESQLTAGANTARRKTLDTACSKP